MFAASMKTAPPGAVFIAAGRTSLRVYTALLALAGVLATFAPGTDAAIVVETSPIANLTYQLDCVGDVVPVCGARDAYRESWRTLFGVEARDDARVARWRALRGTFQGSLGRSPNTRPWFELAHRVRQAGLQARSIDEYERYVALLTTTSHAREIATVLRELSLSFDAWWRGEAAASLTRHVDELREALAMPDMRDEVAAIEAFYGVARGNAPFVVYAVHRPAVAGRATTAQVVGEVAVAEIPSDDTLTARLPVIVHEYAHVLFARIDERRREALRASVLKTGGVAGWGAWMEFDEAIATAIGNGRVYRRLASRDDWTRYLRNDRTFYTRDETDRAAKALLPLVDTFLREGRTIDTQAFGPEYAAVVKGALGERLLAPIALLSEFAMVYDATLGDDLQSVVQNAVIAQTGTYSFWSFAQRCCGRDFLRPFAEFPDKPRLVVIKPRHVAAGTFLPVTLRAGLARQRAPAFGFTSAAGATPMIVVVARSTAEVAAAMRAIFAHRALREGGAYSAEMQ